MKTIGFVVPYFTCGNGTVHPMTQLWLDSCKYNSTVDWLFFTDCDLSSFDVPANVQIIKSSFEEIKAKIQSLFNRTVNMMDENITIEEMKKITKGNIFGWNFKGQLKRIMYLIYKKVRF